jgi:hypothetical protein
MNAVLILITLLLVRLVFPLMILLLLGTLINKMQIKSLR